MRTGVVWLPSIHVHRRPPIRHPRAKLIHTVPAFPIASEVYAVGIYSLERDHVFDKPVKHVVNMRKCPEFPRVGWGAWDHVDTFLGRVSMLLNLPMLVIGLLVFIVNVDIVH